MLQALSYVPGTQSEKKEPKPLSVGHGLMWSDACSVSSTVPIWTLIGMTVKSDVLPHVTNVATGPQNERGPGFVPGWPYSKACAQNLCTIGLPRLPGTGITCGLVQIYILIQQNVGPEELRF